MFTRRLVKQNRADFFYTRFYYLYDRIESSNREPEIGFFLSFYVDKKFLVALSCLAATEVLSSEKPVVHDLNNENCLSLEARAVQLLRRRGKNEKKKREEGKYKTHPRAFPSIRRYLIRTMRFLIVLSYEKRDIHPTKSFQLHVIDQNNGTAV